MSGLLITGFGAITAAGVGVAALAERLASVAPAAVPVATGDDATHLYPEPLPTPRAHALAGFTAATYLGRKGTSSYDRVTGLAVVCCQEAVREAGVRLDATTSRRVGVALGTSLGSFKSTCDFSRETLVQERPYLVNPLLFPNTVMNGAAGQVAIRLGLRGVNATIAGGSLGFLNALRYACNAIDRGYADVMLAGAAEEFTPHRAWASHLTGTRNVLCGEAAGVVTVSALPPPPWAGPRRLARIFAVATGFGPGGGAATDRALAGCVSRVLRRADRSARDVAAVYTGETDPGDEQEFGPVTQVLGRRPTRVMIKRLFGECDAASGAVALTALLAADPSTALDGLTLLTGRGPDGAVGAALVARYADGGRLGDDGSTG